MKAKLVPHLDPAAYQKSALHGEDRSWPQTNCYMDLWIETLHGLGLDPVAGLGVCATIDLEGDQWTFFKYPIADLEELYGLDMMELNVWRSLVDQTAEQCAAGRAVIVELDSFFLPDTAGVAYQREHVKSSVTVESIDVDAKRMCYFHNDGYWAVEGADFDALFRLSPQADVHLPPYVEVAKLGKRPVLSGDAQTNAVKAQARHHLARRPEANPFVAYRVKFERDLEWLKTAELATFHNYAFATIRMFGACFELYATYARWIGARTNDARFEEAAKDFDEISQTAKTLQFKLARAVQGKRAVDFAPMFDTLEAAWSRGMERMDVALRE